ncbi:MAG: GNAT family N-acetyltransferase, partial [Clostridia bacterium]|nr:GNAT family N-acetyltransferase [Clostridia bacterium]
LGKRVKVKVDRPLGSYHPQHKDLYYPINYGYVEGVFAPDGEEQDAYIFGVNQPLAEFEGVVIAVIHRKNDVEDKWVVAPEGKTFTKEEIENAVRFQEQFFDSQIIMKSEQSAVHYICKIASLCEINKKWDYEINLHTGQENWLIWKAEAINNFQAGKSIPYYGILGETIICEATALIHPDVIQNSEGMIDKNTAYLCAFRTVKEYQGQGYFSKLLCFMLNDLKQKGFTKAVLGVEPDDEKNKARYAHWGFTEFIKSATEQYPDGTVIDVLYYGKLLQA